MFGRVLGLPLRFTKNQRRKPGGQGLQAIQRAHVLQFEGRAAQLDRLGPVDVWMSGHGKTQKQQLREKATEPLRVEDDIC